MVTEQSHVEKDDDIHDNTMSWEFFKVAVRPDNSPKTDIDDISHSWITKQTKHQCMTLYTENLLLLFWNCNRTSNRGMPNILWWVYSSLICSCFWFIHLLKHYQCYDLSVFGIGETNKFHTTANRLYQPLRDLLQVRNTIAYLQGACPVRVCVCMQTLKTLEKGLTNNDW